LHSAAVDAAIHGAAPKKEKLPAGGAHYKLREEREMFREISVELSLCSELAPFPDACVAAFEEREHDWLSPLLLTIGTTQAETAFLVAIAGRG
jgi:hypothetical protein